ncbi:hypothetical protein, conserved [Babesia ovata]|uniref:Extracellular matrix-binding ebh n=1 Tax=Babesia ovata TaxID=189622 RepID=A0A2H6KG00_9APIC|nr:uncharacterized protein BOVATA_034000 [Babesia ovata]GBE61907.1 hypothetical protein, conserved [Babesia ovata]
MAYLADNSVLNLHCTQSSALPLACRLGHSPRQLTAVIPGLAVEHYQHKVAVIGSNIGAIDTAKYTLLQQVTKLGTWITTAEEIRKAAEDKAKEAYDKLKVNETLDKNVKLIVAAKDEIEKVHGKISGHVGDLGKWKQEAGKVLGGAIDRANEVYEKLEDKNGDAVKYPVGHQIEAINKASKEIQTANTQLGTEVQHLSSWNTAAQSVIEKAEQKCGEILEKVKQSGPEGVIFTQAQTLKEKGTRLLQAAKLAKEQVGEYVTAALEAVVAMDGDLKKDLKNVKEKIKGGINQVINQFGLLTLDNLVKDDLKALKGKIERLKSQVTNEAGDGNGNIVGKQLEELTKAKIKLEEVTGEKNGSIHKAMSELDSKFRENIQQPLSEAVSAVNEAIEKLGGKFKTSGGLNSMQQMFEHIKGKVGEIKGEAGTKNGWQLQGGSGLLGIESAINHYFEAFSGSDKFESIVTGWLDGILGHNGLVKSLLGWQSKRREEDIKEVLNQSGLGGLIREPLKEQVTNAVHVFTIGQSTATDSIIDKITQVKDACELFARRLEEKLEKDVNSGVLEITKKAKDALNSDKSGNKKRNLQAALAKAKCTCSYGNCSSGNCLECTDQKCILTQAIATTVVVVSSVARQVGNELNSVLLEPTDTNIAKILDQITPIARTLHGQLTAATNNSLPPPNQESPAQAVDSRLGDLKKEINATITQKFQNEVTKDLKKEVKSLEPALKAFDDKAKEQIRAAARTAIERAAQVISNGKSPIVLGGKDDLMKQFITAHDGITHGTTGLQPRLKGLLDRHIGRDYGTGVAPFVIFDKIIITKENFGKYTSHVNQEEVLDGKLEGVKKEGSLPLAIGKIRDEGLKALESTIGKSAGPNKVDNKTFDVPFKAIEGELQAIAGLVDKNSGTPQNVPDGDSDGIQQKLAELRNGLESTQLGNSEKGLDAIKTAIEALQNNTYSPSADAVDKAVKAIKTQLKSLREKLHAKYGRTDDVLNALRDFKIFGITKGKWENDKYAWKKLSDGKEVYGLGKIQEDLKKQNAELPTQTKKIDEAVLQINGELGKIGIRLQNIFHKDDIIDLLKALGQKIDRGGGGGLQKIHDVISELQKGQFADNPNKIGAAMSPIKTELTALQKALKGANGNKDDVITTLNDLKGDGLSGQEWTPKNSKNEKGLGKINGELHTQQNTLSTQPTAIGGGVTEITGELTRLQTQLNNEVTDKLKKLKEHGLGTGEQPWTSDSKTLNGIQKITTDIIAIKDKDVKDVRDKLKELCTAIRHIAKDAAFTLKEVKEKSLNELTGIKNDLHNLQIRLVSGPIKACKDFINKDADKFGKECIASLTAFVDGQVTTAIADITAFAKQQYVSNIKEALTAFAQKVEEELTPLPPLINEDLQIGYKGLMRQVEGKPETQVAGAQGEFEKFEEFVRTLPSEPKERVFKKLAAVFMHFYGEIKAYVHKDITREHKEEGKKKNPVSQEPETLYTDKLVRVTLSFNALLEYIRTEDTFDHRLQALLRSLTDALSNLRPESFAKPSTPVLDGLVEGLTKFAAEFTSAYVSAYAGQTFTDEEGEKCAKVFLTTLPTLCDAFTRLAEQCGKDGKWRDLSINSSNQLGTFLQRCGYKVSTSATLQDGELRDDCNGRDVFVLVTQNIRNTEDNEHLKKCLSLTHACNLLQLLKCLCTHLHQYYKTCHLKVHPSPRPPCSIYEMLTWCCGLPHNPVYLTVTHDAMPSLFEAEEPDAGESEVSLTDLGSLALKAHPQHITPASLSDALTEVCHQSHSVLTTLLGFGHAGGIYACDFNTNPGGLLYPGDADALLCLLYDVLKRLHHQLYLLYRRCLYNTRYGGWLDCWYGRGVGGSAWRCNTMQCANQICDQQCNQTHNQICNQRCDQHPKCGLKSPLQSFLEDGLVGFLPHDVSPKDTCVRCSGCDTESPGLPCKTPMGLSNITRLASRASQGRSIMDVLGAFCGGASSPLTRLCGYLECLLTRPPRTPDDLFAFYYQFICDWTQSVEHRKAAFEDAVGDACFWQRGVTLDVSTVFGTSDHGTLPNMPHLTGDLFSLVECNGTPNSAPSHPCGPYLKPLGHDVRATFAKEHAHLYLSWVVYLTETFYDFLRELLQDCERNCADATSVCHARSCDNQCPAKQRPLAHGSGHLDSCPSIADCDSTTPTLFQYGFVHRDAHSLAGSTHGHAAKRTCQDLCTALQVVVKQMNPLHRLAHETIPEFLYRIRAPFLFTIITLWLIATIYILHSLLYRIDVMRIRSHLLTTKASHLIDVKALLAGSRRMLSLYKDVDYFDDDFHS